MCAYILWRPSLTSSAYCEALPLYGTAYPAACYYTAIVVGRGRDTCPPPSGKIEFSIAPTTELCAQPNFTPLRTHGAALARALQLKRGLWQATHETTGRDSDGKIWPPLVRPTCNLLDSAIASLERQ